MATVSEDFHVYRHPDLVKIVGRLKDRRWFIFLAGPETVVFCTSRFDLTTAVGVAMSAYTGLAGRLKRRLILGDDLRLEPLSNPGMLSTPEAHKVLIRMAHDVPVRGPLELADPSFEEQMKPNRPAAARLDQRLGQFDEFLQKWVDLNRSEDTSGNISARPGPVPGHRPPPPPSSPPPARGPTR